MLCTMYIGIGRGVLLPKDVSTLWNIVESAHEDMTAKISYETVVIAIPEEVRAREVQPNLSLVVCCMSSWPS